MSGNIWNRLRSGSDVSRVPPYITSSQVFERNSSTPDLSSQVNLNFDKQIIAYLYLEDGSHKSKSLSYSPPDYKLLAPIAPRYPIHPREEEGKEKLPKYTSSIKKSGVLVRKMESSNPFRPSSNRSWCSVHVELNNTKLDVYNVTRKSNGIDYKIGSLNRTYTLQYAEIGLAVDYTKRLHVIRIRAETEQFLLLCATEDECVNWTHAIQIGIDLALPLDERRIPKTQSIPLRSRRRRPHGHSRSNHTHRDSNNNSNNSTNNSSHTRSQSTITTPTTNININSHRRELSLPADSIGLIPTSISTNSIVSDTGVGEINDISRLTNQLSLELGSNDSSISQSTSPSTTSSSTSTSSINSQGHSYIPNILSAFSHSKSSESQPNSRTISSSSSKASLRRISFSIPYSKNKDKDSSNSNEIAPSTPSTGSLSTPLPSNSSTSTNLSSPSATFSPLPTQLEDIYDDEDTAANESLQQSNHQSPDIYKWNPEHPRRRNRTSYNERCIPSLVADTPWLNKTVVVKGMKYIVKETSLKRIGTCPPVVQSIYI